MRLLFQMWPRELRSFGPLSTRQGRSWQGRTPPHACVVPKPCSHHHFLLVAVGAAVVSAHVTDGLSCRLIWTATFPDQQTLIFVHLEQRSPTCLASGTSFVEDTFPRDGGVGRGVGDVRPCARAAHSRVRAPLRTWYRC